LDEGLEYLFLGSSLVWVTVLKEANGLERVCGLLFAIEDSPETFWWKDIGSVLDRAPTEQYAQQDDLCCMTFGLVYEALRTIEPKLARPTRLQVKVIVGVRPVCHGNSCQF